MQTWRTHETAQGQPRPLEGYYPPSELADNSVEVVRQEYWRVFSGEFWTFGQRLTPPVETDQHEEHHLSCALLRKRPDGP